MPVTSSSEVSLGCLFVCLFVGSFICLFVCLFVLGLTGVEEYRLVCQAEGGDLVSVHSTEENDFVVSMP